jgi:catechol 2,3-dioxygenase-like lactoylglutathione lyase family enzyme
MAEASAPVDIVLAHFIVSDDVERSQRFYTEVLGGRLAFSGPGGLTYVALANTWIIINVGGGPTDDKPTVVLETPRDPDRVNDWEPVRWPSGGLAQPRASRDRRAVRRSGRYRGRNAYGCFCYCSSAAASRSRAWLRRARSTSSLPSLSRRRSAVGGSGEDAR